MSECQACGGQLPDRCLDDVTADLDIVTLPDGRVSINGQGHLPQPGGGPVTADLLARCRTALAESDETAKAASANGECPYLCDEDCPERCHAVHDTPLRTDHQSYGCPSTRLAHNRKDRVVLDGIAATLERHELVECNNLRCKIGQFCIGCDPEAIDGCAPCRERPHATASLAAIAEALGVQS